MLKLINSLFFLCILSVNAVNAQKYNFKNFSVSDGLTQSEIYAICEDRRGDIWFGSLGGGIIRFNGYTFTSYREEDGLINNFVRAIYEDRSGTLWIGTEAGVCTFDGIKFKFIDPANGPGKNIIRVIRQDNSNNLWFGTENKGLYKFDGKTFTNYSTEQGLPDNTINCLFEDKTNCIWIGTGKGVCKYQDSNFTNYTKSNGLAGNIVRAICEDNKGNIWFSTYGGGASCFNGTSFTNYTVENGLCNNTVFTTYTDKYGRVWFGTTDGVSVYDGISFKNFYDKNGLASNVVVSIYEDSEGDIWFGTAGGGISKLDNERFVHYMENEKMGRQVYSIVQAHNGNMLFATSSGGLTVFDGKNYSIVKGTGNFTSSKVKTLYYDHDSSLWIGTLGDGVYKFNSNGFRHFSTADGLNSNYISGFTEDTSQNLWISSLDSGICVLFKKSNLFKKYNVNDGLGSNNIEAIAADGMGNIWVGSDKGLNKIALQGNDSLHLAVATYSKENGLSNDEVGSIAIDKSNNIYVGTAGGGINVLNGSQITTLTKTNGISSNNIYLLIFDGYNNLWAGTEQGVDRITFGPNLTMDECTHYGKNEGFTGIEVYRNACFKDKRGNMWFGTVNGATVYNAKEDNPSKVAPKIHITNIKLFYDNIEKTKYADSVSAWYPIPYRLTLPHNKNDLTFSFVGIYHRNPEAVRYKWKLEGLNDEWSPALTKHEVNYSNLTPGEYTFKIIACNEYNVWSKDPVIFEFRILPPVWKTWWFMGFSTITCLFLIWFVFHSRYKKLKEEGKREKEKLEMEKNIIVLEQEAARLQMNPHFIFNSLNSIQGFITANDAFQAKRYLAKFARLMRLILENAREEYIPLQNEVDMLENYLELEKLSKNNKFEFTIKVNEEINAETSEIPPMMIQPFVENAIVHGIKNKQGQGLIEINFNASSSLLICEVIDNGVGRQKSFETKDKNLKHKSTGMLVTRKRLEQLTLQTGLEAGFEIIDLMDDNNNPTGTKVVISIPFETY